MELQGPGRIDQMIRDLLADPVALQPGQVQAGAEIVRIGGDGDPAGPPGFAGGRGG